MVNYSHRKRGGIGVGHLIRTPFYGYVRVRSCPKNGPKIFQGYVLDKSALDYKDVAGYLSLSLYRSCLSQCGVVHWKALILLSSSITSYSSTSISHSHNTDIHSHSNLPKPQGSSVHANRYKLKQDKTLRGIVLQQTQLSGPAGGQVAVPVEGAALITEECQLLLKSVGYVNV